MSSLIGHAWRIAGKRPSGGAVILTMRCAKCGKTIEQLGLPSTLRNQFLDSESHQNTG